MDDDYLNIYEYVGEEQHEYTATTNTSNLKEEHEMKTVVSPQEVKIHQQTQINQSSTDTHGFQKQAQEGTFKTTTKGIILTLLIILAVSVSISLAAIVLSIFSYNAQKIEQLKIDTNFKLAISKLIDNMSDLAVRIDDITSVATTVTAEFNISQLSSQLNEINNSINSVATTVEKNVSQLSTWLDAINSSIASVATTAERNITQLSAQLDATNSNIMSVAATIENRFALSMQPEACGTGLWYRVAHLNMSDPSQQCPSAWREYNTNQFRACGRPASSVTSRPSQIFPISHQYSKVCGRVIGIQVASPDAFHSIRDINEVYMDGVSITHGSPRHHIWSYVGSYSEITTYYLNACPCDYSGAIQPQSFVGSNYYCESGNPTHNWEGRVFPNDKLWDGEQCNHEGTCCTGTNTPPWFSVNLGSPTNDDIEVRIMGSESTDNEDTPIELLEIYVQ